MNTLLKILFGLLLILIAVLVLTPRLFDPNDFKEEIRARVAQDTGRDLALDGDLKLSLFPWIGLEINDASLAQPPGFGDEPFAHIGRAQVRARLLSLFRGQFELDQIRGTGLSLNLIRTRDGHTNWDDLAGPSAAGSSEHIAPPSSQSGRQKIGKVPPALAEPESPRPPLGTGNPPRRAPIISASASAVTFTIGGLAFDDVRITWDDRQTGMHLVVGGLTLSTGPLAQAAPVELHLAGDLVEQGRGLNAHLTLDSTLTLSADGQELTLAPFELHLERLTMTGGVTAAGSLTGSLHAELDARRFRLADLALDLTGSGGPIGGQPVQVDARADLALDLLAGTMKLDGLTLDSEALKLSGQATGASLLTAPNFQGQLALAQFDLRAWLQRHGLSLPDMSDPQSLTRVAFQSGWRWADGRLDLEQLDATLDRTRISGSAAVLQNVPFGYRFDLTADALNLDNYLPPSARIASSAKQSQTVSAISPPSIKHDTPPPISPPSALPPPAQDVPIEPTSSPELAPLPMAVSASSNGLFPTSIIRGLDLDGRLRVAQLQASGLALGDVDTTMTVRNGRARLNERIGRFYQGSLQGHIHLLADEDPPALALVQRAEGIQIGPLLKDLIGKEVMTGHGRLEIDLRSNGQSPDAIKRNLTGKGAMHFSRGSIEGFNLEQFIRRAEAQFKGSPAPPQEPERTDFSKLRASAAITNGVITNQDLFATSNYIHANGEGSLDLVNHRLDYLVTSKFVDPPKGRAIKEIEDIPIPIRFTGTLERPAWNIDLAPVLRELGRHELRKELDEKGSSKLQELEERTGIKGLEQGLRRIFDF